MRAALIALSLALVPSAGMAENANYRNCVGWVAADPAHTDPERLVSQKQQMAKLRDALLKLSSDDRLAIALYYVEAMSIAQAAEVLECTPGAYRTRLSRARQRLMNASRTDEQI